MIVSFCCSALFYSILQTVAADANETLEKIDQNLDEPLIKGRSFTTDDGDNEDAMIDADTGIPMSSIADDDDDDDDDETIVPWKTPDEATPEEMKERLVSCEDVFKDPLIVPGEKEQEDEEAIEEEAGEIATAEEETPPEQSEESTTTSPKEKDNNESNGNDAVATFLEGFDLETKTEEITKLLETNAALHTTFSMLSDSVTYADFWTRYFYRIGDDDETNNLLHTYYVVYYQKHLEELEAAAAAEAERASKAAASSGAARLSSFFGGVVSKLTNEGESGGDEYNTSYDQDPDTSGMVDESMDQTFDTEDGPVAAARSALGFLSTAVAGRGGRPPFVMNTAVSDDDDDDDDDDDEGAAEDDDDDSESELGWDDDDDEDFDGLDEDEEENTDQIAFEDGDDRSETVDFKDAEKEGLLEELEQARAERDALQKTVEMQTEELKKAAEAGPSSPSMIAASNASESDGDVVQSLKMQLFEKDAELAALRSSLDDRDDDAENENDDQKAELEAETLHLKQALGAKDRDFETLKNATQAQTLVLEQKLQEQSELQTELEALKDTVTAKDQEFETLLQTKDDEYSKLQHKIDEKPTELEDMILALQSQIYALKRQLEEKQNVNNLDQSVDSVNSLDEAEELRKALSSRDAKISLLQSKAEESTAHTNELQTLLSTKTKELEQALEESTAHTNELQTQLSDKTKDLEQVLEESNARTNETPMIKKLEQAIEEFQIQLAQRTEELEKSTYEISEKTKELEQALGRAAELQTRIASLETDLASKETLVESLEAEVEVLKEQLVTCGEEAQQKLEDATHQHAATILDLKTQLKATKDELQASEDELNTSKEDALETQKEIETLRKQLLKQQRAPTPTSPGSSSSGVKVDVPEDAMETAAATTAAATTTPVPTPPPPQIPDTPNAAVSLGLEPSENNDDAAGGDEGDDGWGDDW